MSKLAMQIVYVMLVSVLLASLTVIRAIDVQAQGQCLPHDAMITSLEQRYDERLIGMGVVASGQVIFELFVAEHGSWAIVMTRANGMSCIRASGYG